MSRLEEALGVVLFHRNSRSRRLSEAGERLLPAARQLLADADRCRELVRAGEQRLPFELTVGTRYELGLSWLCPALDGLAQLHPERTIHLYMADTPDLVTRVERRDLDAVVLSARLTSSRINYATLHREDYELVGPPGIQFAGAQDAEATTLIDVSPDLPLFRYFQDAQGSSEPWRFGRYEYMGGIGAIRYRVLSGHGIAVLPTYFAQEHLTSGALVRLMPPVTLRHDAFRLVWWRGHPHESRLLELADELRQLPLKA